MKQDLRAHVMVSNRLPIVKKTDVFSRKDTHMFRLLVSASAIALAAASASFAGQGDYTLSAGYSAVEIGDSGSDANLGAVSFRGGYEFTRHFGVEGQLDIGVSDDTIIVAATPVDVELNYAASLFGVVRAPVSDRINLFARAGYTTADVDASVPGVAVADDTDGFSYGVGGEIFFDDRNGFRAEFTRHDFDSAEADVWGISYVRRFGGRR